MILGYVAYPLVLSAVTSAAAVSTVRICMRALSALWSCAEWAGAETLEGEVRFLITTGLQAPTAYVVLRLFTTARLNAVSMLSTGAS